MKMRNYMKKNLKDMDAASTPIAEEILLNSSRKNTFGKKKLFISGILVLAIPVAVCGAVMYGLNSAEPVEAGTVQLVSVPQAAAAVKKDLISIPTGVTKADPFLPYRDISGKAPLDVPKFDLVEPPEVVSVNSEAARVMDTTVSGILYDKYSPSAILNIEGNDYLVKKGDTVNNYKVISIMQDSVTVKLGANTYKAGIGEILTEGTVNVNDVSNLDNKFGGKK